MPDTKKAAPQVEAEAPTEAASDLREVVMEYNGNKFTTYAKTEAEGKRIIRAHIAAHSVDSTPAE